MKLFLKTYHNTLKYLVSKATTLLPTKLVEVKIGQNKWLLKKIKLTWEKNYCIARDG